MHKYNIAYIFICYNIVWWCSLWGGMRRRGWKDATEIRVVFFIFILCCVVVGFSLFKRIPNFMQFFYSFFWNWEIFQTIYRIKCSWLVRFYLFPQDFIQFHVLQPTLIIIICKKFLFSTWNLWFRLMPSSTRFYSVPHFLWSNLESFNKYCISYILPNTMLCYCTHVIHISQVFCIL